jgi:hypothetical protein
MEVAMNPAMPTLDPQHWQVLKDLKELLNQDEERNVTPFTDDRIVRYHTPVEEQDVPEIHREARQCIRDLITGLHRGRPSQVVMLAGDPGMGKSHLVNYFRQPKVAEELGYVLVCNSNHWKVGEFEECLLDWLVEALARPRQEGGNRFLDRVQEIAFQALESILGTPGHIDRFRPGRREGLLRRLWSRLFTSYHARVQPLVEARDPRVFRLINFRRFSAYVCDRFLAQAGNPFHRYVMQVLLRYLFEGERDIVVQWLRGKTVEKEFARKIEGSVLAVRRTREQDWGDAQELYRQIGAEEHIDRHYKAFDAIKILISLFSSEVARGLSGAPSEGPTQGKVFFLAFDQTEGRDELFDERDDWQHFFAQLSELYNALPNVFILFTMTQRLRNELHPKMERQFRDRIRDDHRFILREIDEDEILAVYRQRIHRWLRDHPELLKQYEALGNPYLPFDQVQILDMARTYRLREMLEVFDQSFRRFFEELIISVMLDFSVSLKEARQAIPAKNTEFQNTKSHLTTVGQVLKAMGNQLAERQGICFDGMEWRLTDGKLHVLQLQFSDPDSSKRWVRLFLVRLPYMYNAKMPECLDLLSYRQRDRYQLWLTRAHHITLNTDKPAFFELSTSDIQTTLSTALRIWEKRQDYPTPAERAFAETYLLDQVNDTYLGKMIRSAKQLLQGKPPEIDPPEEPDLNPVALDASKMPLELFGEEEEEEREIETGA